MENLSTYIVLEEFERLHEETIQSCLKNYRTYAMESNKFEEECNEIENTLMDLYYSFQAKIKEHNKTFLQNLNDTAFENYSSSLRQVNMNLMTNLSSLL